LGPLLSEDLLGFGGLLAPGLHVGSFSLAVRDLLGPGVHLGELLDSSLTVLGLTGSYRSTDRLRDLVVLGAMVGGYVHVPAALTIRYDSGNP
jgi:hypothetical protein